MLFIWRKQKENYVVLTAERKRSPTLEPRSQVYTCGKNVYFWLLPEGHFQTLASFRPLGKSSRLIGRQ